MMNPKPSIMAEYALVLHQGEFHHRDTESAKVSLGVPADTLFGR
jgi:hypothetical protein